MKIYLDSNPIAFPNKTLLEPHFTIRRRTENGDPAISFTGELTFYEGEFAYLKSKLIDDPTAINNSVELKFIDDCCSDKEYKFLIKPESLKWCDDECSLTANAVENSDESKAYQCLENTLIWDDKFGFSSRSFPRIKYCLEYRPSLIQDIVLILGCLMMAVVGVVLPIIFIVITVITVINAIIAAINALIPGTSNDINYLQFGGQELDSGSDYLQTLNWFKDLYQDLGQLISGCGYEHPSPLVRQDYIQNVCQICGLSFESSILNEPDVSKPNHDYYLLAYLSAPVKAGRIDIPYFKKPLVQYQQENKPIHSGKTFLDEIVQPFNAEWRVIGSKIILERRDFFENQTPFLDTTLFEKTNIQTCYEWSQKTRPAYASLTYQKDAIDWVGNEASTRFGEKIVEWNSPPSPLQKGAFLKVFPFSPQRYRNDDIEKDILTSFDWMPFGIGLSIKHNDKAMIMNNGITFTPKLIVLDPASDYANSYANSNYQNSLARPYNYPMWIDPSRSGNLYDRFWAIEDPRSTNFSGYDFTVIIPWTCQILNNADINGNIITSKGLSKKLESIELDFSTNTMIIKGTV